MKLHNYLNTVSPNTDIRLYDKDGNLLFMGCAEQITESIMFTNWTVDSYVYDSDTLHIWIL